MSFAHLRRHASLRLARNRESARIAHRLEKFYWKNRRAGFSLRKLVFVCNQKNNETTEKPARGFFR